MITHCEGICDVAPRIPFFLTLQAVSVYIFSSVLFRSFQTQLSKTEILMQIKLLIMLAAAFLLPQERPVASSFDKFDRPTLGKPWDVEAASGPTCAIENGALVVKGRFLSSRPAVTEEVRACLNLQTKDFVSIEMDITVNAAADGEEATRVGMFVSREKRTSALDSQVLSQIAVARFACQIPDHTVAAKQVDGIMSVRVVNEPITAGHPMPSWTIPLPDRYGMPCVVTRPACKKFRLGIARVLGTNRTMVSVDGEELFTTEGLDWLASETSDVKVGFFAEGQVGEEVNASIDNVTWTYFEHR